MNTGIAAAALLSSLVAALLYLLRDKGRQEKQWLAERRAEVGRQFSQINGAASDPVFAVNGSTAETVHEAENVKRTDGLVHHYSVTRYVRNEQGEYFMFLSTEGAPFVKHVSQAAARAVLKSKYREPRQGG